MKIDYLSKENTTSVNGIFILVVFINHVQSYISLPEVFHTALLGIGQLMVAMFLFYSGYGVMESIQKKGREYVHGIPVKRVGKVLSEFALAVLFFAFTDVLCGISFTPAQFFLSLVGWESLGNSNWYIFVILCLYLFTWLSFEIAGEKRWCALGLVMLFTILLFGVLHETKDNWWYNTLTAYPFGMFVSITKEKWEKLLNRTAFWIIVLAASFCLTLVLKPVSGHATAHLLMTVSYCIFVLCLTKKVPVYHPVLYWLGTHLFEIYILMRIPMIVMKQLPVPVLHIPGVFVPVSFAVTLLLAFVCHKIFMKMWARVTGKAAISRQS